jgi:hypothetical protein
MRAAASTFGWWSAPRLRILAAAALAVLALPSTASAHGPVAPVALDYLARVKTVPARLAAKIVDGDQRMWLRVPADETVVVLDYRGAQYLRFSRAGVEVNHNSAMFYLNQTFPSTAPASLGASTPPRWQLASGGHEYEWHDGRLHALATVARSPGASLLGTWRVPIVLNGRPASISGGLWFRPPPSIVWFWPIAVLLLCVLAAWRVKRPEVDRRIARLLALSALMAVTAASIGLELHGRPTIPVFHYVLLAALLAFVVWGLLRVALRPPGFFSYFLIAIVALWEGLELIPTLVNGFVLIAVPAFVARAAGVLALGSAAGLLLMVFRLYDHREERGPAAPEMVEKLA